MSWATTNWYWIVAVLLLIYPMIYGVLCVGISLLEGFEKDPRLVVPKTFWNDVVRYKSYSSGLSWSMLLVNKWQRFCLLITLFFVWGYVIFLVTWGLGWILGRMWNLLVSAYQWFIEIAKRLWEAL